MPFRSPDSRMARPSRVTAQIICHLAGGPELPTCLSSSETKLLVPMSAWRIVVVTAHLAADHLGEARIALFNIFESSKCKEMLVDPGSEETEGRQFAAGAAAVKTKEQSASAHGSMVSRAVINARHAAAGSSVAARRRVFGDGRTLYGKGGGVFGLAKLSHLLMEAWMADPELNANKMVSRWHLSAESRASSSSSRSSWAT